MYAYTNIHHCLQPGTHSYSWVNWSNVMWTNWIRHGFEPRFSWLTMQRSSHSHSHCHCHCTLHTLYLSKNTWMTVTVAVGYAKYPPWLTAVVITAVDGLFNGGDRGITQWPVDRQHRLCWYNSGNYLTYLDVSKLQLLPCTVKEHINSPKSELEFKMIYTLKNVCYFY